MHKDRLIYVLTAALAIWCLFMSSNLSDLNKKAAKNTAEVNEIKVTGISTDLTKAVETAEMSIVRVSGPAGSAVGYVCGQENDDVYVVCSYPEYLNSVRVYYDSGVYEEAEICGHDVASGITVLKVKSAYQVPALEMSDSFMLKTGEFLLAVKDADSMRQYTLSSVSHDEVLNYDGFATCISGDQPAGSIILNMNGALVGLARENTTMMSANEVRVIVNSLIRNEDLSRIDLGLKGSFIVKMENYLKSGLGLDLDLFDGFYIESVRPGSFASYCGMENGDVITAINGSAVSDPSDITALVYGGDNNFEITVIRAHEERVLRGGIE